MIYNVKKEEIINDYKLVTKWIVEELKSSKDCDTEDYKEAIDRISCFGKHSVLELCRMVVSENHRLLINHINDMSPFLDVVLELDKESFSNYYRVYCEDIVDNTHTELYPKYIEHIIHEPDFYNEDGTCYLNWQDPWFWDHYLKRDITILDFATKHGFKLTNSNARNIIESAFEDNKINNKNLDYPIYQKLSELCEPADITRLFRSFKCCHRELKDMFRIPNFEFIDIEKVQAFKGADNKVYETEKEARENSFKVNRDSIAFTMKLNSYTLEEQELITKFLNK